MVKGFKPVTTRYHDSFRQNTFDATLEMHGKQTMPMIRLNIITMIVLQSITFALAQSDSFGQQPDADQTENLATVSDFVSSHCVQCHSSADPQMGFDIESLDINADAFTAKDFTPDPFEKMLRKISAGQMPPPDAFQPEDDEAKQAVLALEHLLEQRQSEFPRYSSSGTIRRLTRTEYQNSIRDLLAVEIDATEFLPEDPSSHGFDNITVEGLSPLLLNRYISAAESISRAAIGGSDDGPTGLTVRIPADRSQEAHVAGLPFGTRGGTKFTQQFVRGGQYEIEMKLTRDRDEKVEGLDGKHEIDVLLDGKLIKRFQLTPPPRHENQQDYRDYSKSDAHLNTRLEITPGTHEIIVTFPHTGASLRTIKRQPFDASFNRHRHPRQTPALFQVSLIGPLSESKVGATPSRRKLLGKYADKLPDEEQQTQAAQTILGNLMEKAFRRPISADDFTTPMRLFEQALPRDGFESAIEFATASVLVNPNFLFRIEQSPEDLKSGKSYPISSTELATRLSYFLWSSLPDSELLTLAESNQLLSDEVLKQQVRRMLADPRSESLISNFASQWLYLRNLDSIRPDLRLFPDFDDNLRQSFRAETEHLFRHMVKENASVLSLIDSDFTFLNQRLAKHYGIPNVTGSHLRKVDLPANSRRGGILRHGSILMVTSYATRTAPTIRGNWVLENLLGTPAPPPPPDVPNLKENSTIAATSVRQRLAQHREDPACAACHDLMDPIGFALENYDAVGRWRDYDGEIRVDSSGALPDGKEITNVSQLEQGILERPEIFATTITEKLMTYGLGRFVEASDGPAVRTIVRNAGQENFRFSEIVEGIVLSKPFRFRSKK